MCLFSLMIVRKRHTTKSSIAFHLEAFHDKNAVMFMHLPRPPYAQSFSPKQGPLHGGVLAPGYPQTHTYITCITNRHIITILIFFLGCILTHTDTQTGPVLLPLTWNPGMRGNSTNVFLIMLLKLSGLNSSFALFKLLIK